jgi:RNAse (barnase) inhibitor barstar
METIELDGNSFGNLDTFCDAVERKLCPGFEGFGRNLSAFNDVLRGGFSLFDYGEPISIVWAHSAKSRSDFDYHATVEYLEDIMKEPHPSNLPGLRSRLSEAKQARGETLFDIIVRIINEKEDHPNVHLELT